MLLVGKIARPGSIFANFHSLAPNEPIQNGSKWTLMFFKFPLQSAVNMDNQRQIHEFENRHILYDSQHNFFYKDILIRTSF